MTANQDFEELKAEYARWSNEDLLRVVKVPADYRPAAVEAEREILTQRDPAEVAALAPVVVQTLDAEQETRHKLAEQPLSTGAKVFCFVFCGFPGIIFAAVLEGRGRSRRAHEAWTWVAYGWLARVLFVALGVA